MEQTTKNICDTEGFRAYNYLTKMKDQDARWKHQASRSTSVLMRARWKRARTAPTVQAEVRLTVPEQLKLDFSVNEQEFQSLVERWRRDTRHISSVTKTSMHPAYQRIIGFGRDALPLIFRELQQRGGHWLWALNAITGQDPAPAEATFREAVQAWLDWGRQRGYLT